MTELVCIGAALEHAAPAYGGPRDYIQLAVGTSLAEAQRSLIYATLEHCRGNKTRAAAMLGVSLKTLYNRINEYRAATG